MRKEWDIWGNRDNPPVYPEEPVEDIFEEIYECCEDDKEVRKEFDVDASNDSGS